MPITLDRFLYLDADKKKIVEENDPAARFTLGGPGSVISDEDAKLYGLEEYLKKGAAGNSPDPLQKATQPTQNKGKDQVGRH